MKINKKELHNIFIEIKNQNENEFNKFYEKYKLVVYGIAFSILKNKEDSEEIVQTVFMKIFKLSKEKLPNKNEASWLYTFVKNESVSLLRNKKDYINIEDIYEIEDDDNELNNVINKMKYNQLIKKLNETEKQIVSLKILSNCSFDEIAKLLNKPVNTIKWKYYKAVNTLKIMLSNLAMFIISFVVGLKTIKNQDRGIKEANNEINEEKKSNNTNREQQEETKKENSSSSLKNEQESSDISQDTINENLVKDTENEEKQETILQETTSNINQNVGICILSISAIFLTLTIIFSIFLIKYQLNKHFKSSK